MKFDNDGSAPGEVAMRCMVSSAIFALSLSVTFVLSGERIVPPALATIELNHTVRPSYWAPCSSM